MAKHKLIGFSKLAQKPVESLSNGLAKIIPHDTEKSKIAIGVAMMTGASAMAVSYPVGCPVPHFLYDATAYLLHGLGATPVIDAVLNGKHKRKGKAQQPKETHNQ